MEDIRKTCKYCGKELKKVILPDDSNWDVDYFLVCMDDDCSYYIKGWEHMKKNYEVRHSYRYYVDPYTGNDGPLPVARPDDYKDLIVHKFEEKK